MMAIWKEYALSVIVCTLICGILSCLVSDSARKKLMQLICGTLLAVTVLHPMSGIKLYGYDFSEYLMEYRNSAQDAVSAGIAAAKSEKERYIKEACAAYISNKAASLGAEVTADIDLDDNLIPFFAEINGYSGRKAESELVRILESELGITKENQVWIWNQEDSSS